MPVDSRMMVTTVCALAVAVSAVVVTRKKDMGPSRSTLTEMLVPGAAPTAEPPQAGLMLDVGSTGLSLTVPDCDLERYADSFFVHVYPQKSHASAKYANLDFNLKGEKGTKVVSDGKTACVYWRSFKEITASEVTIGQFSRPDGSCCKIIWSRHYVIDRSIVRSSD